MLRQDSIQSTELKKKESPFRAKCHEIFCCPLKQVHLKENTEPEGLCATRSMFVSSVFPLLIDLLLLLLFCFVFSGENVPVLWIVLSVPWAVFNNDSDATGCKKVPELLSVHPLSLACLSMSDGLNHGPLSQISSMQRSVKRRKCYGEHINDALIFSKHLISIHSLIISSGCQYCLLS